MRSKFQHRYRGFSLLELLAVVTILGIIAAIIVPRVTVSSSTAKQKVRDHHKATINAAVERYYVDTNSWPANDLTVFFRIVLPLSKAVLATIGLFIAVWYWNDFFSSVLYVTEKDMWQLQMVLKDLISNTSNAIAQAGISISYQSDVNEFTIKMASIIVSSIPILAVYPFLQKHFVKGALIGSVKG